MNNLPDFRSLFSYFTRCKRQLLQLSHQSIIERKLGLDSLAIFSLMFSIGVLLDNITFGIYPLRGGNILAWLVIFSIFMLWVKPQSTLILLISLTVQNIYSFEKMPLIPNHVLFEVIFSGILILAILLTVIKNIFSIDNKLRNDLYIVLVSFGRISLILLYFFTVLHKLNYDFFSQTHGCSVELLSAIHDRLFSSEPSRLLLLSAGWLTIIIETIIPLLLCFRATRLWGIIIGCCFHFILAWHPIQVITGFSALMYSLFFLFISPIYIRRYPVKIFNKIRLIGLILIINLVFVSVFIPQWSQTVIQSFFVLWFIGIIVFLGREAIQNKNLKSTQLITKKVSFLKLFLSFLVSLIIIVNGMTSYLGLKTHTNLSMFSNLQTENRKTNHFFIPQTLKLFNFQDNLVEIINTNVKSLKPFATNEEVLLTHFEFQRIISNQKQDFFVDYIHNGKTYQLRVEQGNANYPELIQSNHWLLNKFMSFRAIYKSYSPCQW